MVLGTSSCATDEHKRANRSAKEICDTAQRVKFTGPLVESYGDPDDIDTGVPPTEWWYYEGSDGVCIVPVSNVPGHGGIISSVQFRPGAKLKKKSN